MNKKSVVATQHNLPSFQGKITTLMHKEYGHYIVALHTAIARVDSRKKKILEPMVDLNKLTHNRPEMRETEIDKMLQVGQLLNDHVILQIAKRMATLHELDGVVDLLFERQTQEMLKGSQASLEQQESFVELLKTHYLRRLHDELFPDPLPRLEGVREPEMDKRWAQDNMEDKLLEKWKRVTTGNFTAKFELSQYEQTFFKGVMGIAGVSPVPVRGRD